MVNRAPDRIDRQLISLLRKNARLSNKELAAAVGVAPSTCLERVRRLEQEKILTGYHAEVDPKRIGIGLEAMVAVKLHQHAPQMVEAFQEHAASRPEVVQVFHMAGANDFLVHVAVRDSDHLRELALSAFTQRPEVARIETSLLFARRPGQGPVVMER